MSVDIASGNVLWEVPIEGIKGVFLNMSDSIRLGDEIYFIVSTGMEKLSDKDIKYYIGRGAISHFRVYSRLFRLNVKNGKILPLLSLPPQAYYCFYKSEVAETARYIIFGFNRRLLKIIPKSYEQ